MEGGPGKELTTPNIFNVKMYSKPTPVIRFGIVRCLYLNGTLRYTYD